MKRIFLVRHCQATGQEPDAPLTQEGLQQAKVLAEFLLGAGVDYIYSSPYRRAIESVKPLSQLIQKPIHTDNRLQERVLSSVPLNDWLQRLEETYRDFDLKFEGGESSNQAMQRAIQVMEEVLARPETSIVMVTHGALLSLLLYHFDQKFGFEDWKQLLNPDVYRVETLDDHRHVERVWKPPQS